MPTQVDLSAGRRTNAIVGAFAVGIVYLLGRWLTTRLGGVVGAVMLAFHPLMIQVSSQALADTFLVLALTALAACWLAYRPTWPRALLLGALLGLVSRADYGEVQGSEAAMISQCGRRPEYLLGAPFRVTGSR